MSIGFRVRLVAGAGSNKWNRELKTKGAVTVVASHVLSMKVKYRCITF